MPAFGGRLSDEDIQNVAAFVIDQAEGGKWDDGPGGARGVTADARPRAAPSAAQCKPPIAEARPRACVGDDGRCQSLGHLDARARATKPRPSRSAGMGIAKSYIESINMAACRDRVGRGERTTCASRIVRLFAPARIAPPAAAAAPPTIARPRHPLVDGGVRWRPAARRGGAGARVVAEVERALRRDRGSW